MAVLVGDAPPHGVGCPGDGFPRGCPSGETMESTSAKAEEARVTLYALGMSQQCEESFAYISRLTGGKFFRVEHGDDAMKQMQKILNDEFGQLEFDRKVHDVWTITSAPSVETIAETIDATPLRVASSVCRLQSRGLLLSA
jgi:hypothetical protein